MTPLEEKPTPARPRTLFAARDLVWTRSARVELRRRGAEVSVAGSEEELLKRLQDGPDVVVVDEDLAAGGPEELAGRIRRAAPAAGIVMTGSSWPAHGPGGPAPEAAFMRVAKSAAPAELVWLVERVVPGKLGPAPRRRKASPRIVCVDDDEFYLKALGRILRRQGYRVSLFEDADRALESVSRVRPELALLDVMMPGRDGISLAEEIRRCALDEALPVVFLSGRAGDADVAAGYRAGASYYITKPCRPQTILNVVDYLVGDLDEAERRLLEGEL